MRRRLAVAVALVFAVAASVLAAAGPAGAASVAAVGWWSSRPGASAPEGGFLVGSGLQGPTAVAAIRVDLGDGVTSARLELTEAGGVAEGTAALAVCVTGDGWEAGGGGPLEEAPATACTGTAVAPTRVEGTWTADVYALVEGRRGTVSFAVVPASTQGLWELQFEAPALTARPVPAEPTTTTTTAVAAGPAGSAGAATPASRPAGGSTSFTPPRLPVPPPAAATETEPVASTQDATAASPEEVDGQAASFPALATAATDGEGGPTAGKVLLFALVAAAVGTAAGLGRKYATGS